MSSSKQDLLVATGQLLYGDRWQSDLAIALDLPDSRRIRHWMSGDRPIPDSIVEDCTRLLVDRKAAIDACLLAIKMIPK